MKHWSDTRIAGATAADLLHPHPDGRAADGPSRVVIDSRDIGPGDLFIGIPGEHVDGGSFAAHGAGRGRVGSAGHGGVGGRGGRGRRGAPCCSARRRPPRSARWRAPGGATWRRT